MDRREQYIEKLTFAAKFLRAHAYISERYLDEAKWLDALAEALKEGQEVGSHLHPDKRFAGLWTQGAIPTTSIKAMLIDLPDIS